MNGKVIPNTPIAVDMWRPTKAPQAKLFFLSHAHSDHMSGLTSKWARPVYCSKVTAKIVKHKLNVKDEYLRPLSLNEPHVINLDPDAQTAMAVTLIDANHCPGAVMFLFEGYFGRILYTGDFRYHPDMFRPDTILGTLRNVDDLYLDNTYCHPDCNFPSQDDAKEQLLDLVCRNFDKHIVIPTNELGKEDLFEEVALTTKTYIQVRPEKLAILRLLGLKDVFTTDPTEEQIRLIPRRHLNTSLARKWDQEHPTIIIVPTALTQALTDRNPYKDAPNIHVIPYSEHSSYPELLEFVRLVQPKRLIPIVMYKRGIFGKDCSDRVDFSAFEQYLDERPRLDFCIPPSVQDYMDSTPVSRATKRTLRVLVEPLNNKRRSIRKVQKGVAYQTPEKSSNSPDSKKMSPDSNTQNTRKRTQEQNPKSTENNKNQDKLTPEKKQDGNNDPEKKKKGGNDNPEKKTKDGKTTAEKMEEETSQEVITEKDNVTVREYRTRSGIRSAVVEVVLPESQDSQEEDSPNGQVMDDDSDPIPLIENDSSENDNLPLTQLQKSKPKTAVACSDRETRNRKAKTSLEKDSQDDDSDPIPLIENCSSESDKIRPKQLQNSKTKSAVASSDRETRNRKAKTTVEKDSPDSQVLGGDSGPISLLQNSSENDNVPSKQTQKSKPKAAVESSDRQTRNCDKKTDKVVESKKTTVSNKDECSESSDEESVRTTRTRTTRRTTVPPRKAASPTKSASPRKSASPPKPAETAIAAPEPPITGSGDQATPKLSGDLKTGIRITRSRQTRSAAGDGPANTNNKQKRQSTILAWSQPSKENTQKNAKTAKKKSVENYAKSMDETNSKTQNSPVVEIIFVDPMEVDGEDENNNMSGLEEAMECSEEEPTEEKQVLLGLEEGSNKNASDVAGNLLIEDSEAPTVVVLNKMTEDSQVNLQRPDRSPDKRTTLSRATPSPQKVNIPKKLNQDLDSEIVNPSEGLDNVVVVSSHVTLHPAVVVEKLSPEKLSPNMSPKADHVTKKTDHATQKSDICVAQQPRVVVQRLDTAKKPNHVTEKADHVGKKLDHVAKKPNHITKKADHVTEKSDHVTKKPNHVTEKSDHVTGKSDHVTEESDNVTEQEKIVIQKLRNAVPKSPNVNRKTVPKSPLVNKKADNRMVQPHKSDHVTDKLDKRVTKQPLDHVGQKSDHVTKKTNQLTKKSGHVTEGPVPHQENHVLHEPCNNLVEELDKDSCCYLTSRQGLLKLLDYLSVPPENLYRDLIPPPKHKRK